MICRHVSNNLSIRCILGDVRLWVGDPSTSSCLVSLPLSLSISLINYFITFVFVSPPAGPARPGTMSSSASDRRGNTLKGFGDFHLKATTRIWSWLSYMCRVRSTSVLHQTPLCLNIFSTKVHQCVPLPQHVNLRMPQRTHPNSASDPRQMSTREANVNNAGLSGRAFQGRAWS